MLSVFQTGIDGSLLVWRVSLPGWDVIFSPLRALRIVRAMGTANAPNAAHFWYLAVSQSSILGGIVAIGEASVGNLSLKFRME